MRAARQMICLTLLFVSLASTAPGCGLDADNEDIGESEVKISPATSREMIPTYGINFSRFPMSEPNFSEHKSLSDNHVPYARVDFVLQLDGNFDPETIECKFEKFNTGMREAAAHGVHILPIISFVLNYKPDPTDPTDCTKGTSTPPALPKSHQGKILKALRSFSSRLASTYGPCGSFWADETSVLPIRAWEVLNEENSLGFFQGNADDYYDILQFVHAGLRAGDPRARVVFGGLSSSKNDDDPKTPRVVSDDAETFLSKVLRHRGDRCLVDAVAYHPYAHEADDAVDRAARIVDVMRGKITPVRGTQLHLIDGPSAQDDAQFWITELGWGIASNLTVHPDRLEGSLVEDEDDQRDAIRRSAFLADGNRGPWRLGPTMWYVYTDAIGDPNSPWAAVAGVYSSDDQSPDIRPAWGVIGSFAAKREQIPLPSVHSCGLKEARRADNRRHSCSE